MVYRTIRARAPVRICDLGGWTDTRIFRGEGAVLNFTPSLYTYCTLEVSDGKPGIDIESLDTNEYATATSMRELEYDGVLNLAKAALLRRESAFRGLGNYPTRRLRLLVRSDAPPASGLGSSAALGVALVAVMNRYANQAVSRYEVARMSHELETEELKLECGVQDQFAAAYGGINFMEINYPDARVRPVRISETMRLELEDRMVIVYTGQSRFSSDTHRIVIAEYEAGRNCDQFRRLAECAMWGKQSIESGELGDFAGAMNENWAAQKALHPYITTPAIEGLHDRVSQTIWGFKANGAGGGGTVTILAKPNCAHLVRRAVVELGMEILPVKIDFDGLQVWEPS